MMPMRGSVASLSRKSVGKEQSSKDVCMERIKLSELALQRWKDFGDAHKAYNDLQSWKVLWDAHKANDNDLRSPIAKFVSTHSSSDVGEQKQEHHVEENLNKKKAKSGAANSRIQANVEVRGLRELLVDFEGQFQKTLEEIGSVCKLLEIDTVQEQTTTKRSSSSINLARSVSKRISALWSSRSSSKVRSLPSDEKDGEHTSTLKYLGAWERQLYYQVEKISDVENRKIGGAREEEVAKQSAVLIFNQIKQLRDQELSPQLDNLLGALTTYWVKISDCYNAQAMIMSDIVAKSLFTPPHRMSCEASHLEAAKILKAELEEWLAKFTNLVSSHKAYIKALHDWARYPFPAFCEERNSNGTQSLLEKWSNCSDRLFADVTVSKAMSDLGAKVGELVELQNKEHEHKRQVNQLNEEDWKIGKSSKTKDKSKLKQKIKEEEVKYEDSRKETEKTAVNLVQTGFTSLFQSLAEFSKNVAQSYGNVEFSKNVAQSYGNVDRQNNASAEVNNR